MVILDFEDKQLAKTWIGELTLHEICEKHTLCVDTPHGGIHIYLIVDDEVPPQKFNPVFEKDGKRIADLQSFNSYVVGPESCINHKFCTNEKCPWKGQDYTTCYIPINNNEIGKVDLKDTLKFLAEKGKKLGIKLSPSAYKWVFGKEEEEETEEDFERLKKELIKHDSGKPIEKVKEEICSNEEKNKLVREVICQGRTYSDVGIDRSRGDWRVILYLLKHGVTDPEKILQLLPSDSKAKENEKWDTNKYFMLTLSNAWTITKKYLEVKKAVKTDKAKARELLIEAIAEEILKEHKLVAFVGRDQLKEWVYGLFMFRGH